MKFQVIYADPAWTYDDKALAGNRGAGCKYTLMDDAALAALPVRELAAEDAILFLWATFPKIQEALHIITAWGFRYKTVGFTWVKVSADGHPRIGMGRWTRSNAEVCLIGTRGKPKRIDAGVNQVILAPSLRHSAKPPEVRERITRLMGEDVSKIELFARDETPGWVALGNEIDGRDLVDTVSEWAKL